MSVTFKVNEEVKPATKPLQTSDPLNCIHKLTKTIPEAYSKSNNIVQCEYHGLVGAAHTAYCDHRPLALCPDTIWITIAQGIANHINMNAEKLRHKFVSHEGKQELKVRRDNFIKGSPDNDWPGVFGEFSDLLAEHIGEKRDMIEANFSTTGPLEKAVSQLTLMDAMQSYFDYTVMTLCGIPSITIDGTPEDWHKIRAKAEAFREGYDLEWWIDPLLSVLDEFVNAAEGNPNVDFWKDFYHLHSLGSGSPYITGNILNMFPYLKEYDKLVVNEYLGKITTHKQELESQIDNLEQSLSSLKRFAQTEHIKHRIVFVSEKLLELKAIEPTDTIRLINSNRGPVQNNLPSALSKVPFKWEYYQQEFDMEFIGGIVGIAQESMVVRPSLGWAIQDAKGKENATKT